MSQKISPRIFVTLVATLRNAEKALQETRWDSENPEPHAQAQEERRRALDALREAIASAPWGQNGSIFITNRAASITSFDRTRTLHIQGREVATLNSGWVRLIDPSVAESDFLAEKTARRKWAAVYTAARERLVRELVAFNQTELADFGEWRYSPGQKGGYFFDEKSRCCVAATSAMAKAETMRSYVNEEYEEEEAEALARAARRRHC